MVILMNLMLMETKLQVEQLLWDLLQLKAQVLIHPVSEQGIKKWSQ